MYIIVSNLLLSWAVACPLQTFENFVFSVIFSNFRTSQRSTPRTMVPQKTPSNRKVDGGEYTIKEALFV
jgi:hypothetical protein